MITEDQLEQLAIQWFQDTGWNTESDPTSIGALPPYCCRSYNVNNRTFDEPE